MKKLYTFAVLLVSFSFMILLGQEWSGITVPADAGSGNEWILQENVSDDFSYTFNAVNSSSNFGSNKWSNFYHNQWDGPGTTYWKYNHVSTDGDNLVIKASRWDKDNQPNPQYPYPGATETYKMNLADSGVNSGCVTSNNTVLYPVFVESAISVANIELASCFWLLSADDTQEIDIIENYGGVEYFKQFTHISHHSFIREPFHDYQPRDWNSWWPDSRVSSTYGWGDWCWNNGSRRYLRLGVYWITPNHFEYYIDGNLVRVLYHNAIATNMNGTWEYTYYNAVHPANTQDQWGTNIGGMPVNAISGPQTGYSEVTVYSSGSSYSFSTLQAASDASNGINVIDPGQYQGGTGFTKELDIIINVESQSWLVSDGKTPSTPELSDNSKNEMKVDWVRVYKPVPSPSTIDVTAITLSPSTGSVDVGSTMALTGAVVPLDATDQGISYSSNNTGIATVNANGVVTGVAAGSAVITATSDDGGFQATSTIAVNAPSGGTTISVEAESFTAAGGSYADGNGGGVGTSAYGINYVNNGDWVEYSVNISESGIYDITYYISTPNTSNTNITCKVGGTQVSIDAVAGTGGWDNYTAQAASGQATLSAESHTIRLEASGTDWQWNLDKFELEKSGASTVPVTGIALEHGTLNLNTGGTYDLTETVSPVDATDKSVTWSSNATGIVTVNANGLVSALAAGSAIITATTNDGGFVATCNVMVTTSTISVTGVTLNQGTLNLTAGGTYNLTETVSPADATDKSVMWNSNNSGIASVNSSGLVTAVAAGTTTITVTTDDGGHIANCNVTVTAPSGGTTISIEAESFIADGGSYADGNGGGVGIGTYGINYVNNGDWVEYSVSVSESGTYDIIYYISTPNTSNTNITCKVDGSQVSTDAVTGTGGWDNYTSQTAGNQATLSAGGHVIRLEAGGTDWQWNLDKIELVKTGTSTVPVTGITLDPATLSVEVGATGNLTGSVQPGNATDQTMSFSSDNTGIATVNASGVVTGVAAGTATITVTSTDGGFTDNCVVTVTSTPPPEGTDITLEAEEYSSMGGVNQNGTMGGKVGTIGAITYMYEIIDTDWLEYSFSVGTEGSYQISFIAGSDRADQNIEYSLDGAVVATQLITQTGSLTTFGTTVATVEMNLTAGTHTLKLVASGTYIQWNLDKIELTRTGAMKSAKGIAAEEFAEAILYPNPAVDQINIKGVEEGYYNLRIINLQGVELIKYEMYFFDYETIVINELPDGLYILNIYNSISNKAFYFNKKR